MPPQLTDPLAKEVGDDLGQAIDSLKYIMRTTDAIVEQAVA